MRLEGRIIRINGTRRMRMNQGCDLVGKNSLRNRIDSYKGQQLKKIETGSNELFRCINLSPRDECKYSFCFRC